MTSHEGCYGTDLPGDQLTGTVPVEVHAGRSEFLQEHGFIDFVVHRKDLRSEIARLVDFCGK